MSHLGHVPHPRPEGLKARRRVDAEQRAQQCGSCGGRLRGHEISRGVHDLCIRDGESELAVWVLSVVEEPLDWDFTITNNVHPHPYGRAASDSLRAHGSGDDS